MNFIRRLGRALRRSNNARATFWLAYNAHWFFWNVTVAFLWNATTTRNSFGLQRAINESDYGMAVTDLELAFIQAPFFLKPFVAFWQLVVAAQGFSWLFWFISLFCSVVYFVASLREGVVETITDTYESVSRRSTTDLPDQPSWQESAFMPDRRRFFSEAVTLEMIREGIHQGIQKGWHVLRRKR